MLMILCTNLRRIRPDHVNLSVTRSLWRWELQHRNRFINGQHVYPLGARHYVQAPEARPIPDGRAPTGLQQQKPPQQQKEKLKQEQPQQQQQQLQQKQQQQELRFFTEGKMSLGKTQDNQTETRNMASGVDIPYDISWIFPRLRNPSALWYVTSQLVITLVGIFSKLILVVLNKTQVHNKDRLISAVGERPKDTPLVTVCNHHSCFDDPGIWAILPLRYLCNTLRIRWGMAAHDICFTRQLHARFFMYGKCIPVVRGYGVYQSAIDLCIEKCALGHWVHVFPEGKVNMDKEELRLKWGVGRIIYESPKVPIILPMWHEGMDTVLPNVEPYMLKCGKKVTVNVGQPLDLNDFIQDLKSQQVPETVARALITDKVQKALYTLRDETKKLHGERFQQL